MRLGATPKLDKWVPHNLSDTNKFQWLTVCTASVQPQRSIHRCIVPLMKNGFFTTMPDIAAMVADLCAPHKELNKTCTQRRCYSLFGGLQPELCITITFLLAKRSLPTTIVLKSIRFISSSKRTILLLPTERMSYHCMIMHSPILQSQSVVS